MLQTARRPSILAKITVLACALHAALAARAQEGPQRLPAPEVPVRALSPEVGPLLGGPQIDQPISVPYGGPPAAIDGPARLPSPGMEILPETIAPGIGPEELVPFADSPIGPILPEAEYYAVPQKLSSYKDGFFQKLSFSGAWIGTAEDPADLGVTEIELFLTVALPAPIKEWPLFITPGINMYFLDGPGVTDLPPRLNTAYVDFMWAPQIFHRYRFVLSVAPSVLSDFQSNDADMFRLTGKALVVYDWVPDRVQLVAGVLYLNRDDVSLLPAGGLIWTPTDWTHFELIFPKPKLGVRFGVGEGYEDWLYTTAEFGGNTWAIQRDSGAQDKVTYLDYRLLLGVERKLNGGAGYRIETGYVFGRTIEFASGEGNFEPQDTFILRGGLTF